jgi:hypothetical protein
MTGVNNPVQLAGLKQAAYVMKCLVEGYTEEEIVKILGKDQQLVVMWISFLRHNQWMEKSMEGWSMTAKGVVWSKHVTSP